MNVRTIVTAVSIVALGVFSASCGAAHEQTKPNASPSRTAPRPEPASAPESGTNWLQVAPQGVLRTAPVSLDVASLATLGLVRPPVLDIGPLRSAPAGHHPCPPTGTAPVPSDAAPGQSPISVTCGAATLTAA